MALYKFQKLFIKSEFSYIRAFYYLALKGNYLLNCSSSITLFWK